MNNTELLEAAIKAAVPAGNLLIQHYNDVLKVSVKESMRDVVTALDHLAETKIIESLTEFNPNLSIVSEEQGQVRGSSTDDSYWIVDALDGTVNYVNQIPNFCVSIAFVKNGSPAVGVIYNPFANDLYYGALGIGAFKNQGKLSIKDKPHAECLFSAAFSGKNFDPTRRKDEYQLFGEINDQTRGVLRTGSAGMNLAFLAEGRLGGCWGKANKFWDVAAGLLIAELAGAKTISKSVDPSKRVVSYVAAVPSAWEFAYSRTKSVLEL